ncbi:MarR family winged helix-turn-helix transcriptional regulator [uncultured Jatrophihabitans sp.]|uniref:MarR family winged helix-turn-helix transcriptional regulator n=1 Tax=uncultured Jatrophihabitans sp. TaxID=1610747 RepID=UPI0035CA1AA4
MTDTSCERIGGLFIELHHRIHRLVDVAMTDAGLSLARAKVLGVLAEHGPVKQASIATILGFAPRSVTDTLDALEREGLATRSSDAHDRRVWLVEITPQGAEALDRALVVKRTTMKTIYGGLDGAEREQLITLLTGIRTHLDSQLEAAHVS